MALEHFPVNVERLKAIVSREFSKSKYGNRPDFFTKHVRSNISSYYTAIRTWEFASKETKDRFERAFPDLFTE